jgi:endonuclease/exonuclease/phosphatase family metal-dependent hydrolase
MKPFQIDFCFIANSLLLQLRSVQVGTYGDWIAPRISDHTPLVIDLDLSTQ